MLHKIFDSHLVTIRKSKTISLLHKPAYIGMCILKLSKVLMYEFHYDCIKTKSRLLFKETDSSMYEIKTEDAYEDFSIDKEMFDFSNYLTKSKYYDDSSKLVIRKNEKLNRRCCNWRICWIKAKDVFIFGRQQ